MAIFNIQRYSIHDGPGIRTTVFFKGCPLSCWWCHNPESIERQPVMALSSEKCMGCGVCVTKCHQQAISLLEERPVLDRKGCLACGECQKWCPSEALQLIGNDMTVNEVLAEIEKDRIFYDESGGGVTFSGGEPLLQPDFLFELLSRCRELGLHTAIDTSGFAPWAVVKRISEVTDLFLYDLKHMDSNKHCSLTGVPNDLILQNLRRLTSLKANIHLRIPIIPTLNDDKDNIMQTGRLAVELGISQVHILPYHRIGTGKYQGLGRDYQLPEIQSPSPERMQYIADELRLLGLLVAIGG